MRRLSGAAIVVAIALLAAGCGTGSGSSDTRKVLVDFSHDEFATFVAKYFPDKVAVTQGQTLEFHQTWTGETHTVTGGTGATNALKPLAAWLQVFTTYDGMRADGQNLVDPENPGDARWADFASKLRAAKPAAQRDKVLTGWRTIRASGAPLPDMDNPPDMSAADALHIVDDEANKAFEEVRSIEVGDEGTDQTIAQPCFLRDAAPKADPEKPCAEADRTQPPFDGRQAFYNSGVLPYEGPRGNTYKVKIADDAVPGTYFFYCAIHGPTQQTKVEIRKRGAKVPSQAEVSRQARKEIDELVGPMQKIFTTARTKNTVKFGDQTVKGPFAGLPTGIEASINEFVPKRLTVKAGAPITWTMAGNHTISFHVPKYLPIVDFTKPKIEFNSTLENPAGGAAKVPDQEGQGVQKFDGGTYNGTGFWSSGLVGADPYLQYTLRITKPGTYSYACLVHPPMVGTLVVTPA